MAPPPPSHITMGNHKPLAPFFFIFLILGFSPQQSLCLCLIFWNRNDAGGGGGGGGGDGVGGGKAYDALLLDAGGTLLQLATPVEETYASIGIKYGNC